MVLSVWVLCDVADKLLADVLPCNEVEFAEVLLERVDIDWFPEEVSTIVEVTVSASPPMTPGSGGTNVVLWSAVLLNMEELKVEDGYNVDEVASKISDKSERGVNEGRDGAGVLLRGKAVGIVVCRRYLGNWYPVVLVFLGLGGLLEEGAKFKRGKHKSASTGAVA